MRYTYLRSIEGPWLLYDNESDPYQMNNLIDTPAYADLQKELEGKLHARLTETGDSFLPQEQYLKEWGYEVNTRGEIPYNGDSKIQSPAYRPK